MTNRITGRSAFVSLMKDEGVTHLFGNPGTTELPIMHALVDHPDMRFVLGLHEALVVAMADGYSRASGELVACNVHVAPDLGERDSGRRPAQGIDLPALYVKDTHVFGLSGAFLTAKAAL